MITQLIDQGKVVDSSAEGNSISKANEKQNNSLDKDAFLQLLVAQMKYQDPLEPTDNTQYISQLATFSQLEGTQNMQASLEAMQGDSLVGKQVILKVTSSVTGETTVVTGKVDYVVHENSKTYLSVNDGLYSIEDLDKVVDDSYLDAISIADDFDKVVAGLPSVSQLNLADEAKLVSIRATYESLSSYQKGFIDQTSLKKFEALEAQMAVLKAASGESADEPADVENGEETESGAEAE